MNTIKFAPYNEFVTEQHNIETATCKTLVINNKNYSFYEPCNLNIFITNACPNRCRFCINEKNTWEEVQSDEDFLYGLEQSLKALQGLHVEATITGGEPTLLPNRFVKTIQLLKKYGIHERTVSTTGWNLIRSFDNNPHLLEELKRAGYTHNISISRMSIDETVNNQILQSTGNITNDDLRKIGLYSKVNGIETRISCNLMPEGVSTLDDIITFVDFQEHNNISSCLFRELEGCTCKIDIEPIFDQVKTHPAFTFMEHVEGVYYSIDYYKYVSEESDKCYIVKLYTGHKPTKSLIGSLSYNSGTLKIGFTGETLWTK